MSDVGRNHSGFAKRLVASITAGVVALSMLAGSAVTAVAQPEKTTTKAVKQSTLAGMAGGVGTVEGSGADLEARLNSYRPEIGAQDDDGGGSGGIGGVIGGDNGSGYEYRWWAWDTPNRDGNAYTEMGKWDAWSAGTFGKDGRGTQAFMDPDGACDRAYNDAISNYGGVRSDYRIVLVGSFIGDGYKGKTVYRGAPPSGALATALKDSWDGLTGALNANAADRDNYLRYVNELATKSLAPRTTQSCVVLKHDQPVNNYNLSVNTQQQGGFANTGATGAVHDQVVASNNGSTIGENIWATSTLHWYGYPNGGHESRSKNFLMGNNSITQGPNFTPGDFGWSEWPAGHFGFGLDVPQSGHMAGPVSYSDSDPAEAWDTKPVKPTKTLWKKDDVTPTSSASVVANTVPYVARVSAHTAGSAHVWLYDTILQDAWVGASDHDDLSKVKVTDGQSGATTGADISIDRSQPGRIIVKAHVKDWVPRLVTLHVPTYPKVTKQDQVLKDDSKACWNGDNQDCQTGDHKEIPKVTPKPDKVWTVDENGALVASDKGRTNKAGKDNRTFVPGDKISAVVNGRIPAGLTGDLEAYTITDDWTGAASYVDFSDASKAKVYVDGKDRTSDFTITVSGSKTIAKAKSAVLAGTKDLPADKPVKLIISGKVKLTDVPQGATATNGGSEQWGNEGVDSNIPSVFVRSPNPDKVWVLDATGALITADPNRTNTAGKDQRTFVPGDSVGAVVSGRLPKGLATDLSKYEIIDDWSDAAKYVDFTDTSKAKVYIDGQDRTGDFTIKVVGTTTVATANASVLKGTENLAADKVVKLYVGGTFKLATDTDNKEVKLTNTGSEQWNDKKVPTNVPPVFVRSPKPDKAWVLDATGALATADPNRTDKVGKDQRTFVPGDSVGAVVNGRLPKGLATDLSKYEIIDDWTDAAKYVDFTDTSKTKVYIDGQDRTGEFTIKVVGTTTVATANASVLKGTENLPADKPVKLYVGGTFKVATDTDGKEVKLTNTGSEQWNNKKVPTNTPPVFVRSPKPDKAWLLDANGALNTADPNRTNNVGEDNHVFIPGDEVGAVVNGRLPKNLATDLNKYEITDDWSDAAKYVDFTDASKAKVWIDGKDRTSEFTITVVGTTTVATAKPSVLKGTENMPADHLVKLYIGGRFKDATRTNGKNVKLTNTGFEQWNSKRVQTNVPPVFVWTPNPDKSWVGLENGDPLSDSNDYKLVIDPTKSNKTGADAHSFRLGDRVASVVNATVPATLARVPSISLRDDWSNAERIVDFQGTSKIRIYDADVTTAEQSSLEAIDAKGRDVTGQFTITVSGSTVKAVAKPEYTSGLKLMGKPRQISMLVSFTVNFDPAKLRADYGKQPGDQLDTCSNPGNGPALDNLGGQQAGSAGVDSNRPGICVTVPQIHKDVLAESSQGGDMESVDGKHVLPGQKLEYQVNAEPLIPATDMYEVTNVQVKDTYDRYTTPDKPTLEITDLNTGKIIPRSQWTSVWDDSAHAFTVAFNKPWVLANWKKGSHPRISIRFEARVNMDAPTGEVIDNQAWLTINNGVVPSNQVENTPPQITPVKDVTQTGKPTVSVDGKTFLLGDKGEYHLTLDAHDLKDMAYRMQRLGLVDDYEQDYLNVDSKAITVKDKASGQDVTSKFNIQINKGVAYVFAKTVDTIIPATGETVKGDPQPTDLKAYGERKLDPLSQPYIDQSLCGRTFDVTLPFKVIKVTDGHVIKNQATQITDNRKDVTNQVSNPVKPINPSKDVVINVGGESANGKSVWKDSKFLYQLDSSILPPNRAYPQVDRWDITDQLDPQYDEYTGQWAVYATRDLYQDGKQVAAKGDRIAGTGFDSSTLKVKGDLFQVSQNDQGLVTVNATDVYRALVSADTKHEAGWRAYLQVKRLKVTEHHENRFDEHYNDKVLPSNVVWTRTPDLTPGLHIEKWDRQAGWPDGDRDTPDQALTMRGDTEIVFTISNTSKVDPQDGRGAWYQAKDLKLEDETVIGQGKVVDLKYPDNWDTLVLKPGDSVEVTGTLKGVQGAHTDRAKVTGTPLLECRVDDTHPFDKDGDADTGNPDAGKGDGESKPDGAKLADTKPAGVKPSEGEPAVGVKPAENIASDAAASTDRVNEVSADRVTIDGKQLCRETQVQANPDDWNGRLDPLPATGVAIMSLAVVVIVAAAGGTVIVVTRSKRAQLDGSKPAAV